VQREDLQAHLLDGNLGLVDVVVAGDHLPRQVGAAVDQREDRFIDRFLDERTDLEDRTVEVD
jgi:hypothetical protein